MNQTLNNAQRKLVEDNHNLIYSFLNSHNLSLDSVEDWYGAAAIGLCKAAMIFDESRGVKFSVLAYVCMDNQVRQIMRQSRQDIAVVASLDDDIGIDEDGCCLSDVIPDPSDRYCSVYLNDAIDFALRSLNERDKQIVRLIINEGLPQSEIAAKFEVTHPTVSRAYNKFLRRIRGYFND